MAGVEEQEEPKETIGFLREPERYGRLGACLPDGGSRLARSRAVEAGVPFFSIRGSELVEVFTGVGATRVRDLFEQERGQAPRIVFIDELGPLRCFRAWLELTLHPHEKPRKHEAVRRTPGL